MNWVTVSKESPNFHSRLRLVRTERGISRKELAEKMGVHYQTIGYVERGEYSPSLDLTLRLAQHFELPVEALFSLDPFPHLDARALTGR
jgi:putative transcriptional regulator